MEKTLHNRRVAARSCSGQAARQPWRAPVLTIIDVRETHNGIDPLVADGSFSMGS
jgi:hypothetical protein